MLSESTRIHRHGTGLFSAHSATIVAACVCLFCLAQPARAGIVASGDVQPADPGTWTSSTDAYIGKTWSGTLGITDGDEVGNRYGYIGYESGSTGAVTVDGAGSTWTNGSDLSVGHDGDGTLNITGGGAVSNEYGHIGWQSGSTGEVTVNGDGSTWTNSDAVYVGQYGRGTLNITGGGAVSNEYGHIGFESGSTGEVTVDGVGSTWTKSGYLHVGYKGSGTLNITGGGAVSSGWSGYIGYWSGSTGAVTVDGAGSTWTNSGELYVGYWGSGTLNITGGGAVSNIYGEIGSYSGSTGVVTVDGAGSTWTNSGGLSVGFFGSGTLNITGGGAVTVEDDTWVASSPGSSGTIHFDNGTLTTGGLLSGSDALTGTGTIDTHGLVSDVDLVFDATHGLNQTFSIDDNPGQDITVNLNVDGSRSMGAGYADVGTMSISDGTVIESTWGYIGYKSGSTGVVTVDGAGSTWTNGEDLFVGDSGDGTLSITGGGAVSNEWSGYIGYESGSTGAVTVDGSSSTWTNSGELYVGYWGSGTLNITGGGAVSNSGYSYIGFESGSTGVVTVDGAGSTWTNSYDLYVGRSGSGTLNITGGGAVTVEDDTLVSLDSGSSGTIYFDKGTLTTGGLLCAFDDLTGTGTINTGGLVSDVGLVFDATHGLNQTFTIDDNLGQDITVNLNVNGQGSMGAGYAGVGTTMSISDGRVIESTHGYIGYKSGSTGAVTVDGAGSTWTNSGNLYVGLSGSGTLSITAGGAVSNTDGWLGFWFGSTGEVTVDGPGSTWTNSGTLFVGREGSGTLNITGGGEVGNRYAYIGYESSSSGVVTVDGTGSTWTNGEDLFVGDSGDGTLNITGGGAVSNGSGYTYIGYESGSTGVVTVNGAGSTWTNSGFDVGRHGSGTLNITGGGAVSNGSGYTYIGYESGSTGAVTVDGGGSTWTNSDELYVGYEGRGTLSITGGGAVSNWYGTIGYESGSTGAVAVAGVGSTWTNGSRLYVGRYGDGTLSIMGGGAVTVGGSTWVASDSGSSGTIHFDDGTLTTGGLLCTFDDLTGTGTIDTGGLVSDVDLVFDATHGLNQTFTIDDNPGQDITVNLNVDGSGSMGAGFSGVGTMSISDGRVIESTRGYIGYKSGSTGEVTVDGAGSTWTNSGGLSIGYSGSGTLNITNGGAVTNDWGNIGSQSGSTDEVTVDGTGSTWTNNGGLRVGDEGSGTLNITGGGAVSSSGYSYIGHGRSSTGVVTVDGAGSTWTNWTNSGYLNVGWYGSGTLNITDGGAVSNIYGEIGSYSGSTGVVTVDGAGSTWTNSKVLYVGNEGSGTLNITGGGAVSNSVGYIGYDSGSTGEVTVDGAGSTWTNSRNLYVGSGGRSTLNITGGGAVTVEDDTWVSRYPGSSGAIHFDNGTLRTGGLLSGADALTGTGTIDTGGLVSDVDLVFDATHGLNQTFTMNDNPGQDITVNLNVDGSGSMGAGYGGVGTISISDGRVIESTWGYVGYKSGSTGEVTVDGGGSTWTNGDDLYIGRSGSGTLNITGGGAVSNSYGYIGSGSGSTGEVTVAGAGSTWTNSGGLSSADLVVGSYGSGTLSITGGGAVSSSDCSIARQSGSTGVVTVDGAGSTWTNSGGWYVAFVVGGSGSGTLSITAGGAVSNRSHSRIGYSSGSTGVVTVDGAGSTWTNRGLNIGESGSGTLNITGGGAVSSYWGRIGCSSGSTGVVRVDGAGSTWTNSAALDVGHYGSAMLSITGGGLVSVAGTLTIDSDDDGDGFINMATGGMLALNGDADDSLAEFFGLINGTDAIRYWNVYISDWADITGAAYGQDYTLSYLTGGDLAGYSLLTVFPDPATIRGDANLDGEVGIADLCALADNYGLASGATWANGDFNGDGVVGIADLSALADNYGRTAGGTVPEPAGLVLLAIGWIALARRSPPRPTEPGPGNQ